MESQDVESWKNCLPPRSVTIKARLDPSNSASFVGRSVLGKKWRMSVRVNARPRPGTVKQREVEELTFPRNKWIIHSVKSKYWNGELIDALRDDGVVVIFQYIRISELWDGKVGI